MIWTLNVKLIQGPFAKGPWQATIELDADCTLDELHHVIQQAVEFDNDHLYEFFLARTPHSTGRVRFDDDNGELYERTVASFFPLPPKRALYYLFDYGDNWIFQVARTRAKPFTPEVETEYPRVISEQGEKPPQYPDWDD